MTVEDILKKKKGGIKNAPLEPGSPSWDDIMHLTWDEIDARAIRRVRGFRTFRKLLNETRFDK
jgi:hypothetical protein